MIFVIYILLGLLQTTTAQDVLKQNLYVGQSVKLKCGPIERYINIPMTFQWEKPVGNVIGNQSILSLRNVDFKDGGTYTCRATHTINDRTVEKVLATQLLINRRDTDPDSGGPTIPIDPPTIKFSDSNQDSVELMETGFLYSTCSVNNWVGTDYVAKWMKYQKILNGGNSNLFIFPLDAQRDSGTYTCEIYHKNFPEQKYERELRVTIKKPEIVVKSLPNEDLRLGGRIYRKCEFSNGKSSEYEQLTHAWLKDNSGRVSISDILDIPITDASVNGEYSCVINALKGEKKYVKRFVIRIDADRQPQPGGHTINIFTQPMSPELNKPYQLSCQVLPPFPNSQYQWIKDGIAVSNQQVLTIPSFSKQDIGSYSCKVSNIGDSASSSSRSPSSKVNVQFMYTSENKIELYERGSQMISRVGEKRELHCEIPSNSNTAGQSVRWFFNGREVDETTLNLFNIHRLDGTFVSILSLLRISTQNEGQYACEVGGVRKSANLIILEEQSSMEVNPERLEKNEGNAVEFHCRVNNVPGFSNTQITWTFKSRDGRRDLLVERNPRWTILNNPNTPETSFISTQSCQTEDDGYYTCTIPSGRQKVAELIVRPNVEIPCPANNRRCNNGNCLPSDKFCDGERNCPDGSDENPSLCSNILLTLSQETVRTRANEPIVIECFSVSGTNGQPIGDPRFYFEFGRSVERDQRMVETIVGPSRRRLSIPRGLSTSDNGLRVECRLGDRTRSATIYLEGECSRNYKRCNDGKCVPSGKFCDGFRDCSDGSDESSPICNIITLTITPETLRVRVNQPIVVECFSVSGSTGQPIGEPRFTLGYGRNLGDDPRLQESNVGQSRKRLSIPGGLQMSDSGMKVECRVGAQTRTTVIHLENECPPNYRRCYNGDCQPSGKFCDGVRDCSDGSDETPSLCNMCDPISVTCDYNAGKLPIKKIYLAHWRCDGENDCGNDYDESQCTAEDARCSGMNFTCRDGKVIPRAYQCDRESDCSDSDDEQGCVSPQITRTSDDKIKRIRRGDFIKLTCESVSVPKSHILWRHNWGCLRDKSRMQVSNTLRGCDTVVSVLTIRNFQPGDDGVYNCEALSAQSRAFSADFQLILESI